MTNMLKKLFSKKSFDGADEQEEDDKTKCDYNAPNDRKSKTRPPLRNASSYATNCQKENKPVSTHMAKEIKDAFYSDGVLEFKCFQCKSPDGIVKAAGYCTDCKQFVCTSCIEWHYTKDNMKNHIMLKLLLITRNTFKQKSKCHSDIDKEISDKNSAGKEVDDIVKNAKKADNTNECQVEEVVKDVSGKYDKVIKDNAKQCKQDTKVNNGAVADFSEAHVENRNFEVNPCVKDVDKHTKQDRNVDKDKKVVTINSKGRTDKGENNQYVTDLKPHAAKSCNDDSKTTENIKGLTVDVRKSDSGISKESTADKEEHTAKDIIPEKFTHIKDVKVKYEGDMKSCFISAIAVLSDKRVAVLDHNNKNIKTLHIDWGIDGVIQFSNSVGAMTSLPNEQIAVTIPQEKRIKLLSTIKEISVVSNIRFLHEYFHIVYCNGKLLVTLHEPLQFRLLGMDGILQKKIIPTPDVSRFITTREHMHIAISQDEECIYVSNTETNAVIAMNMDGAMVAYKDRDLDKPSGIIVIDSDEVFVCNRDKHSVHKMTNNLLEAPVMLSKDDGILFPYCLSFYPDKKYLFVSCQSDNTNYCNNIKQFKVNS